MTKTIYLDAINPVNSYFEPSCNDDVVLAGEVGFEPTNGGFKGRCLTTWRLPNSYGPFYRYLPV